LGAVLEEESWIANTVRRDGDAGEDAVRFGMFVAKSFGCFEAVYEEGFASCFGLFETMLHQWE
jgi:hypothetical protein